MQDYSPADFDELADWLLMINSDFSPAELDGAIVGGLSGGMRLSQMQWAQFGLAVAGADPATSRAEVILGGLAQLRLELLTSDDLTFQPYLPDDDEELELRTAALASWSKGFLGGFAEAQARSEQAVDRLPENVEEALRDLMAIGQVSLDDDAHIADSDEHDDYELGEADDTFFVEDEEASAYTENDDEKDYFEIVEYLKLAALTVFTEVGWVEMAQEKADKKAAAESPIENLFGRGDNTLH